MRMLKPSRKFGLADQSGTVAVKEFLFLKTMRIRSKSDFDYIYNLRQRVSDKNLLMFAARNYLNQTRIGLSVSRKHGGAVKRAKLKRLLREAFRLTQHELPQGIDFILIPRQNPAAGLDGYQRSMIQLAGTLAHQLSKKDER